MDATGDESVGLEAEPRTYGGAAQHVRDDAQRRSRVVVQGAKDEARDLSERLRGGAAGALSGGKTQLAAQIGGVARALRAGGREFRGDGLGGLATFSDGLAEQVEAVGRYLDERSSEALLGDLRSFAGRHRGLFVGSLFVAGLVAVRLAQTGGVESKTPARTTTVVARGRVSTYRTGRP